MPLWVLRDPQLKLGKLRIRNWCLERAHDLPVPPHSRQSASPAVLEPWASDQWSPHQLRTPDQCWHSCPFRGRGMQTPIRSLLLRRGKVRCRILLPNVVSAGGWGAVGSYSSAVKSSLARSTGPQFSSALWRARYVPRTHRAQPRNNAVASKRGRRHWLPTCAKCKSSLG